MSIISISAPNLCNSSVIGSNFHLASMRPVLKKAEAEDTFRCNSFSCFNQSIEQGDSYVRADQRLSHSGKCILYKRNLDALILPNDISCRKCDGSYIRNRITISLDTKSKSLEKINMNFVSDFRIFSSPICIAPSLNMELESHDKTLVKHNNLNTGIELTNKAPLCLFQQSTLGYGNIDENFISCISSENSILEDDTLKEKSNVYLNNLNRPLSTKIEMGVNSCTQSERTVESKAKIVKPAHVLAEDETYFRFNRKGWVCLYCLNFNFESKYCLNNKTKQQESHAIGAGRQSTAKRRKKRLICQNSEKALKLNLLII